MTTRPLFTQLQPSPSADEPAGQPFAHLQYCVRCCIPQTQEGVIFDELGVCQACQSAEQKIHIDWTEREKVLRGILDKAKAERRQQLRLHHPHQRRQGQHLPAARADARSTA